MIHGKHDGAVETGKIGPNSAREALLHGHSAAGKGAGSVVAVNAVVSLHSGPAARKAQKIARHLAVQRHGHVTDDKGPVLNR